MCIRTYTYIRTHISPCVCARVCAYIFRTGIHTKASLPCIPTPSAPLLPPHNDLGQSYSASTSSSVLQLFSSPLSINLPPSPPLHAVDYISPPKFVTEACNICNNLHQLGPHSVLKECLQTLRNDSFDTGERDAIITLINIVLYLFIYSFLHLFS